MSGRSRDGTLISPGRGADLLSDLQLEDFKLHIEFMCAPGSNSGVYLRGRYEVQIEDDPIRQPAPELAHGRHLRISGARAAGPRKPAEWQAFDLTLVGRHVTVVLDGGTIIADQEIPGITGGALDSHEALPGPIYLQGGEEGRVDFSQYHGDARASRPLTRKPRLLPDVVEGPWPLSTRGLVNRHRVVQAESHWQPVGACRRDECQAGRLVRPVE